MLSKGIARKLKSSHWVHRKIRLVSISHKRIGLATVLGLALVVMGLHAVQGLLVAAFVLVQWTIGRMLVSIFGVIHRDNWAAESIGLAIGAGIFAILVPFINPWNLFITGVGLIIVAKAIVYFGFVRPRCFGRQGGSASPVAKDTVLLDFVVFSMGLFLAGVFRQTLVLSAVALLLFLASKHFRAISFPRTYRSARVLLYGLSVTCLYFLASRSGLSDSIPGRDNLYLAGQIKSLSRHGLEAIIGFDIPLKYHWLSLGWLSGLAEVASIDAIVAVHVLAPVSGAFLFSVALFAAFENRTQAPVVMIFVAVVALLSNSVNKNQPTIDFEGVSNYLPLFWLLALVSITVSTNNEKPLRTSLLASALISMVTLAQGVFGLTAIVGWALFLLLGERSNKPNEKTHVKILQFVFPAVAFSLTYWLFISSSSISRERVPLYSPRLPDSLMGAQTSDQVFLIFRIFPVAVLLVFGRRLLSRANLFPFTVSVSSVALASLLDLISYGQERFLIVIGVLSAFLILSEEGIQLLEGNLMRPALVGGGYLAGALATGLFIAFQWQGSMTSGRLFGLFALVSIWIFVLTLWASGSQHKRELDVVRFPAKVVVTVAVTMALLLNAGAGTAQLFRTDIRKLVDAALFEEINRPQITEDEFSQVKLMAQWIDANTVESSLIATDRFCANQTVVALLSLTCAEYEYPVLSSLSNRQVYVEVGYELHLSFVNVKERIAKSLSFGKTLDVHAAKTLLSEGVTHFVHSRSAGSLDLIISGDSVLYANDYLMLIDLKKFVENQI